MSEYIGIHKLGTVVSVYVKWRDGVWLWICWQFSV